jgi:hypothetical protein
MGKFLMAVSLALAVTLLCGVNATGLQNSGASDEIKSVVRGAVEDSGWMKASTKKEMQKLLSQYFTGKLLDDLTGEAWDFIQLDTDWHGKTTVEKILINSIDENAATVLAYIKEVDVANKTSTGMIGEFILVNSPNGWRINQMIIRE